MTALVVFGANGPTGRRVVQQALASNHRVIAVTRKPAEYPVSSPNLDIVSADVTDPAGVDRALAGADAVISTYGVPYGKAEITVYSHGIANVTQAMTARGISRLVCVSSTTVAAEDAPGESLLWRKVIGPVASPPAPTWPTYSSRRRPSRGTPGRSSRSSPGRHAHRR